VLPSGCVHSNLPVVNSESNSFFPLIYFWFTGNLSNDACIVGFGKSDFIGLSRLTTFFLGPHGLINCCWRIPSLTFGLRTVFVTTSCFSLRKGFSEAPNQKSEIFSIFSYLDYSQILDFIHWCFGLFQASKPDPILTSLALDCPIFNWSVFAVLLFRGTYPGSMICSWHIQALHSVSRLIVYWLFSFCEFLEVISVCLLNFTTFSLIIPQLGHPNLWFISSE
jgi:hypothetical protein